MSKSLRSSVLILLMMGLTAFALLFWVDVELKDTQGIRMDLPETLDGWTGRELRYCHAEDCRKQVYTDEIQGDPNACPSCGTPLFHMSYEEWDVLPKDTEFLKSQYTRDEETLFVSIVLSGRDRESIHRPERCLVGQGLTITRRVVIPATLKDGRSIRLMVIEYQRPYQTAEGPRVHYGYYSYWFVGVGRETHSHWARMFWLAWDRVINSVAHKWAYVSISGLRNESTDSYQDTLRAFVAELHAPLVL
ncbi:MAG: exosortase-associated EpsI family protein [Kiritimatiellia bacterium]|nr:exosortase-associated EpsI family protein [Kiritimatiellia bacterium]